MRGLLSIDLAWGVMLLRVATGLLFAAHGYAKFRAGFPVATAAFVKMGIPFAGAVAPFIAGLELFGGIFLIVGFLTRFLGLLFACEMVVTTFYVKIAQVGWNASELDRVLLAAALLLLFAGPGILAVDALWLERPSRRERGRHTARR